MNTNVIPSEHVDKEHKLLMVTVRQICMATYAILDHTGERYSTQIKPIGQHTLVIENGKLP